MGNLITREQAYASTRPQRLAVEIVVARTHGLMVEQQLQRGHSD